MIIIFEDNANTPSSVLLRHSCFSDKLRFSEGNKKLLVTISKYLSEDIVLVFVDVVPDNECSVMTYIDIRTRFINNTNVFVMPILCIEYILLLFLKEYYPNMLVDNAYVDSLITNFDYNKIRKLGRNLEKVCKGVLANVGNKYSCLLNDVKHGDFYTSSCICDRGKHINCDTSVSLSTKANQLYCTLPLYVTNADFDKIVNDIGKHVNRTTLDLALQEQQKLYDYACERMSLASIRLLYVSE
jgi:hypothetical protein